MCMCACIYTRKFVQETNKYVCMSVHVCIHVFALEICGQDRSTCIYSCCILPNIVNAAYMHAVCHNNMSR